MHDWWWGGVVWCVGGWGMGDEVWGFGLGFGFGLGLGFGVWVWGMGFGSERRGGGREGERELYWFRRSMYPSIFLFQRFLIF